MSESNKPGEPFLTIPGAQPNSHLEFETERHADVFLEQHLQFWNWIFSLAGNAGSDAAQKAGHRAKTRLGRAQSAVASLKVNRDTTQSDRDSRQANPIAYSELREAFIEAFSGADSMHKELPQWQILAALAADNQPLAAHFAGFVWKLHNPPPEEAAAAIAAIFRANGLQQGYEKSYAEFIGRCENSFNEAREKRNNAIADWEVQLVRLKTNLLESVKSGEDELQRLRKEYVTISQLKEPINYWEEKRKGHLYWAQCFTVITVAVAVFGVGSLVGISFWIGADISAAAVGGTQAAVAHILSRTFPLAVIGAGVFWALRVLVRILLSHYHLCTDAGERVVLARTYQVLEASGTQLKDEDRSIILRQLFRHAATGVVKDDAAPQIPLALINAKTGE